MPSAEETTTTTTYLIEVMPPVENRAVGINHQRQTFSSHDVDLLVSRVKENLRLTNLKSRSSRATRRMRQDPYRLHSNSWSDMDKPKFDKQKMQLPPAPADYYKDHDEDVLDHHNDDYHHQYEHSSSCARRKRTQLRKMRAALDCPDSYERLQALLRQGALIKEAVKRLQTNEEEQEDDDVMSDEEEEERRKKRATSTSATNTTLDSMDDDDDDDDDVDEEDRLSNLYPTLDL